LSKRGIGYHRIKQPWRKWLSLILGLVLGWYAFGALAESLAILKLANCPSLVPPGFWTMSMLLLLAGLQTAAWPRRLIKFLMLWTMLAACHAGDGKCHVAPPPTAGTPTATPQQQPPRPATPVQTLANSVTDMVENVSEGLPQLTPPDEETAMLTNSNATGANGLWLVSVGQAAANPGKVANCEPDEQGNFGPRYSVYLGEDAFFNLNSPKLNPVSSKASLKELLEFIEANPESRFVITGHTDSTGTDEVNIPLSLARAKAVAEWLLERGVEQKRLRIVGAGSSLPLIRPTAEVDAGGYLSELQDVKVNTEFANRMNRRVEVAADCPLRATR
jgi:outer membrane protein OmpA-like peptidoglycan-associated protein